MCIFFPLGFPKFPISPLKRVIKFLVIATGSQMCPQGWEGGGWGFLWGAFWLWRGQGWTQWKGCGHQSWFPSDRFLLRAEEFLLFSEKDAGWRARLSFDFFLFPDKNMEQCVPVCRYLYKTSEAVILPRCECLRWVRWPVSCFSPTEICRVNQPHPLVNQPWYKFK